MKKTTAHCVTGANGSSDRPSGENPAVAIVENECAVASKNVIRWSAPVQPSTARTTTSSAVIPT